MSRLNFDKFAKSCFTFPLIVCYIIHFQEQTFPDLASSTTQPPRMVTHSTVLRRSFHNPPTLPCTYRTQLSVWVGHRTLSTRLPWDCPIILAPGRNWFPTRRWLSSPGLSTKPTSGRLSYSSPLASWSWWVWWRWEAFVWSFYCWFWYCTPRRNVRIGSSGPSRRIGSILMRCKTVGEAKREVLVLRYLILRFI